ncbi:iron-siderophore ABC transporter substrate-binding protein [Brevibacterium antiquum]|uniref:ABC transporter substrate-binding protein n=1 Tax=Brevibacterium antiquum TaxID=234835 RepID=UPI0018E021C5|nr:ABC transporter substrate-binding protein [Brevibacterium antiquum]
MKRANIVVSTLATGAVVLSGCSAPASSGSSGENETGSVAPVTVDTLKGEVEVPADPKNVVALNTPSADVSAQLGTTPVAVATNVDQLNAWQQGVLDAVADDSLVSDTYEVNVEKVASYEPDVIFAAPWNVTDKAVYDQLSDIAPVVVPKSESTNPDWDVSAEVVGEALGKKDEVDEIIATTKKSMKTMGQDLGVAGKTYQVISPRADGIYFGNAAPLELLGLEPGQHQAPEEVNKFTLSAEELNQLDADFLFIWAMGDDARSTVEDNPSFDSLPAVKNGTAKFVGADFTTAINGASPASLDWLMTESDIQDVLEK